MGRPAIERNADARTRLLNSLGMFQEPQQRDERRYIVKTSGSRREGRDVSPVGNSSVCNDSMKFPKHIRSHSDTSVRSALHNTVPFETSLNDELAIRSQNQNRMWKMRSLSADKISEKNEASVRFNTVVSGVKIPSRNQYSRRIKQTLWRDRYELSQMIERNTTEFHSENYDWKQVVLEDQMYVDLTSGEKVHPCHVEGIHYRSKKNNKNNKEDCKEEELGFIPLSRSESIVA